MSWVPLTWSNSGNFPAGANAWNAQPLALAPPGTYFTPDTKPCAEEANYLFGNIINNLNDTKPNTYFLYDVGSYGLSDDTWSPYGTDNAISASAWALFTGMGNIITFPGANAGDVFDVAVELTTSTDDIQSISLGLGSNLASAGWVVIPGSGQLIAPRMRLVDGAFSQIGIADSASLQDTTITDFTTASFVAGTTVFSATALKQNDIVEGSITFGNYTTGGSDGQLKLRSKQGAASVADIPGSWVRGYNVGGPLPITMSFTETISTAGNYAVTPYGLSEGPDHFTLRGGQCGSMRVWRVSTEQRTLSLRGTYTVPSGSNQTVGFGIMCKSTSGTGSLSLVGHVSAQAKYYKAI